MLFRRVLARINLSAPALRAAHSLNMLGLKKEISSLAARMATVLPCVIVCVWFSPGRSVSGIENLLGECPYLMAAD